MVMNKVLFHTIFALGCLSMLAACGNDDITNDVDMHTVKVVSAKPPLMHWEAPTVSLSKAM